MIPVFAIGAITSSPEIAEVLMVMITGVIPKYNFKCPFTYPSTKNWRGYPALVGSLIFKLFRLLPFSLFSPVIRSGQLFTCRTLPAGEAFQARVLQQFSL